TQEVGVGMAIRHTGLPSRSGSFYWRTAGPIGSMGGGGGGGGDVGGWLFAGFEWGRLRDWGLVGAGGRVGLEAAVVAVIQVTADDMQDSGDRDGQQGAQEPEQLDPDEDADQ